MTTLDEFRVLAEHAGADSIMQSYPVAQFTGPRATVTVEFPASEERLPEPPLNVADILHQAAILAGKS